MKTGYLRVTHPCATLLTAEAAFAFDLHVLSTPPAFVLSQDQTLQLTIPAKITRVTDLPSATQFLGPLFLSSSQRSISLPPTKTTRLRKQRPRYLPKLSKPVKRFFMPPTKKSAGPSPSPTSSRQRPDYLTHLHNHVKNFHATHRFFEQLTDSIGILWRQHVPHPAWAR